MRPPFLEETRGNRVARSLGGNGGFLASCISTIPNPELSTEDGVGRQRRKTGSHAGGRAKLAAIALALLKICYYLRNVKNSFFMCCLAWEYQRLEMIEIDKIFK